MKVADWVKQFCETCDDATSLHIMRGRAIGYACEAIHLLDCLDEGDKWISLVKQDREAGFECIDRIEARLTALGLDWDNSRNYGVSHEEAQRVEEERKNRNG